MDYIQIADTVTSLVDVTQVANVAVENETPAWLGGILGMVVVMVALTLQWGFSAITGTYFAKNAKAQPKKTEAVTNSPVAASAAAPSASMAANGIPLAVILAAVAQMIEQPIRNVMITAPAFAGAAWTLQGRETIFASHALKAPHEVFGLGAVKKG